MRIVFVSHHYSPDIQHPEDWFRRIAIYTGSLTCLSKQYEIIRVERIGYKGACRHEGIQYYFQDYGTKKLYVPWRLHRFTKSLKPDVLVVNGTHFAAQAIQLRMQLGSRVKIFMQNHAEKPFTGAKKYLQRLTDYFVDGYFFSSRAMGEEWVKSGNLRSSARIHEIMEVSSVFYPLDKNEAVVQTGVNGDLVFLWVGRLNENKNPLMVLRAFLEFSVSHPEAALYLIYQTDELLDEMKVMLSEKESLNRRIYLIGKQSHERLLYWYNSADFIISGSWYEGSGTAVCEAMSCGCIPILTNIHAFQAMTANGQCGILYEAGSPASLCAALERAIHADINLEKNKVINQFRHALSFQAIANRIRQAIVAG
jgi:glycosyltransferase involved in cell wall biosynthesis